MNKLQLIQSLKSQGFSEQIIKAFNKVQREKFIPENSKIYAYEDTALSIGKGQTISQPYTIAFMLSLLELQDKQKIMEIGSGSGYVLALLNTISKNSKIYGVERIKELVERSKSILKNKKNIKIIKANKELGIPNEKFDRILVSAAADKIPDKLIEQLKVNGIIVIPVRNSIIQIKKTIEGLIKKEFHGFVFVPLIED